MDDPYALDRRQFLKVGATAAAATAVGCDGAGGRFRTLTDEEALTLEAVCARIVPKDQDPGAAEAGVVFFIDRQLATLQKDKRQTYGLGLKALDRSARRLHQVPFKDLSPEQATSLLVQVEGGRVEPADWPGIDPQAFFRLVVDYSMMGFYGDPRHGGNRDRVSWTMLGLKDPPLRGRLHEG